MVILLILLLAIIAGYIALHILAIYKDNIAAILFWGYVVIASIGVCFVLIGVMSSGVLYFSRVNIIKIVMFTALAIVPVALHIFPQCKKWIKWLLYIFQMIICVVVLLVSIASFEIEAPEKPLGRAEIEEMMKVKLPGYRIVSFDSFYDSDYRDRADLDQTLKLKGNTEQFYKDLDALCDESNSPYGLQWYKTEDGYELPGIGRGGIVKVTRKKHLVYISTTIGYE